MKKEECELIAQATTSIARMTIHYCDYVEELMAGSTPSEENLQTIQSGIKTLNHISVTLERLRRVLLEPESIEIPASEYEKFKAWLEQNVPNHTDRNFA